MGNPPDDPGCNLNARLYIPDPINFPGPRPGIVMHQSAGLTGFGGGPTDAGGQFFAANGWVAMYADNRTMKGVVFGEGGTGIPGQTTDGRYHQQTDDHGLSVQYLRAHPLCDGFVASYGGSGGGFLGLFNACSGVVDDTRPDAAVALSAPTDWSDRITNSPHYINVGRSYNRVTQSDTPPELALLLAQSPAGLAAGGMPLPPIYFANGEHENMPFSQYTLFKAALDAIPFTNYVSHINLDNGGQGHSFGTFPENKEAILVFLNNARAAWNGGAGDGRKPLPRGLADLLPAPGGHVGDISAKGFLNNPNIPMCRARLQWLNVQPSTKSITGVAATNVVTSAAHGYSDGDALTLVSVAGGAGLTANSVYYVRDKTTDTFKLAATAGGAAIDFSTDISAGKVAVFDWDELDAAIADCAAHGKKLTLSVAITAAAPEWVYTDGTPCTRFDLAADDRDNDDLDHMALIWQTGFKTKADTFIQAMGDRYDSNPFLAGVFPTGPGQIVELHYIQTEADYAAANIIAQGDGFSSVVAAYTPTAKHFIDKFFTAFPTTQLMLNQGNPFSGTPGGGDDVNDQLFEYGHDTYGDDFGEMASFLHASLPPHVQAEQRAYCVGKQPIHSSTFLPGIYSDPQPDPYPPFVVAFEDCMLNGAMDIGCHYLEVYEGDVENTSPDYQAVIKETNDILVVTTQPPPPAPIITSFTPTHGEFDSDVQLSGANFTGATSVLFGGVAATTFAVSTDTSIIARVPAAAVTGFITVITPTGQAISVNIFTVDEQEVTIVEGPVRSPILIYPKGGRPPGKKTPPNPPTSVNVTVSDIPGDFTAMATWVPPVFNGNSPITGYFGYITGLDGLAGNGEVGTIGPNDTQATITGLEPDKFEEFHIATVNAYGRGEEAPPFQFLTNPAIVPPPPDPTGEPRGIFHVIPPKTSGAIGMPFWLAQRFWDESWIAGSTYEGRWDLMEPTAPVAGVHTIDFTDLDAYLANCVLYEKSAILSFEGGLHTPAWSLAATPLRDQFAVTGPNVGTYPFPWAQIPATAFTEFLTAVVSRYAGHAAISAYIVTGVGQLAESILTNNDDEALRADINAGGLNGAGGKWMGIIRRNFTTITSASGRAFFVFPRLERPIPNGTQFRIDGDHALDLVPADTRINDSRGGSMCNGLTAISDTTTKKFAIVSSMSRANVGAGYRLATVSSDPALDPSQGTGYDALTGLTAALANAVTLKAKFVEVFPEDSESVDPDWQAAFEAAITAMEANP